jgi:hypothetical protein
MQSELSCDRKLTSLPDLCLLKTPCFDIWLINLTEIKMPAAIAAGIIHRRLFPLTLLGEDPCLA